MAARMFCAALCFLIAAMVPARSDDLRGRVEAWVAAHEQPIFGELVELLSIPNVAADSANIRRNAERLAAMLARRGLRSEVLETAGNPLVYGERRVAGAAHTVLLYAHYDGQPVDAALWKQASPFRPVVRSGRMEDGAREVAQPQAASRLDPEWRVYARSASDDKAPIVALCAALDALAAEGRAPASNIRVVLDGEEEAGSLSLEGAISRYREKLSADVLLILDGPLHPSGRPTLNFGARGVARLELTVYGPKGALHSGHYGNWVPNPAFALARLLASMKDDDGRVKVAGFYDGIASLSPEERRILQAVPDDMEGLRRLFGIARTEQIGGSLQEALQFPTLNIRGLRSAYVGADARTVIPSEATAALDLRLVQETPSAALIEKLLAHIRGQGFHVVEKEPDDAARLRYPKIVRVQRASATEAYRTRMDVAESKWVAGVLARAWGEPPVQLRTSGGTVPIAPFIRALGLPAIAVPIVNFDNNQHSENENLRLGHLWRGIVTFTALLTY
jgi:acetylornithine deacetylase/succinyl-diaminopimelate desuccinylase-like protein